MTQDDLQFGTIVLKTGEQRETLYSHDNNTWINTMTRPNEQKNYHTKTAIPTKNNLFTKNQCLL